MSRGCRLLVTGLGLAIWMSGSGVAVRAAECVPYLTGDANADGGVDVSDPVAMLLHTFAGVGTLPCRRAADLDGNDTSADVSDAVYLLRFLFQGGPPPVVPYPECGLGADSALTCDSYPPCEGTVDCFDWVEVDGPALPEETAPPTLDLSSLRVAVGEPLGVEIASIASHLPATIDWGDGTSTPVLGDGVLSHVYFLEREVTVELLGASGETLGEEFVDVAPRFALTAFSLGPDLSDLPDLPGEGGGEDMFDDPPLGGDPCLPFDLGGPPNDPAAYLQPSLLCGRFLPGASGLGLHLQGTAEGDGMVQLEVVVEGLRGDDVVIQELELPALAAAAGRFEEHVGVSLEGVQPGIGRIQVRVSHPGDPAGRTAGSYVFQVLDTDLGGEGPCEILRLLHQLLSGVLAQRKSDCADIEKEIERAKEALGDARGKLGAARGDLTDAQAARDALETEKAGLVDFIQGFLGGSGQLTGHTGPAEVPAGQGFVGTHGVGIAFASAGALLERSSAVEQSTGTSLLAAVNELGQVNKKLDAANGKVGQLEAQVTGLEGQVAALEARIGALEAALEACRDSVEELEGELEDLEAREEECLRELALRRRAEQAIRDASDAVDRAQGASDGVDEDADDADELIGGSAGSPDELEGDGAKVDAARSEAGRGDADLEKAQRLLGEAKDALAAGDSERAKTLADEAKACADVAQEHVAAAQEILDEATDSARARGPRVCQEGEEKTTEWIEYKVWKRILSVDITPSGLKPEEWENILERGQSAIDGLVSFLKLVDAVSEALVIEGAFTPEADRAAQAIFDAHVNLLTGRVGVDAWALLEGDCISERTILRCVHGRWVVDRVEREVVSPVHTVDKIGTILVVGEEERKKELSKLLDAYARRLVRR